MAHLATARLGIETLDIARLAHLEGRGHVDFLEVVGADDVAREPAQLLGGTDKGGQGDDAGVDEELGHLGNAADVFPAVLRAEAEVGVDAGTDVVAVEQAAQEATAVQLALQGHGQGALAGTAQAGEPEHHAALAQQTLLVGAREHTVEYGVDVVGGGHGKRDLTDEK